MLLASTNFAVIFIVWLLVFIGWSLMWLLKLDTSKRSRERVELRKRAFEASLKAENERRKRAQAAQAAADAKFKEDLRRLEEQLRLIQEARVKRAQHQQRVVRKKVITRGDVRRARVLLAEYGGYKEAVKQTHPDYGGNAVDFDKVIQAKKLVDRFPHVI